MEKISGAPFGLFYGVGMGEGPTRQETGPVRAVSAAPGGGKQRDAAAAEGTRRRRRAKAAGGGGCGKTGAVRSGGEAPQAGKTKDAASKMKMQRGALSPAPCGGFPERGVREARRFWRGEGAGDICGGEGRESGPPQRGKKYEGARWQKRL